MQKKVICTYTYMSIEKFTYLFTHPIDIHVYRGVDIPMLIHICVYICIYTRIYIPIYIYIQVDIYTYTHICKYIHVDVYVEYLYIYLGVA